MKKFLYLVFVLSLLFLPACSFLNAEVELSANSLIKGSLPSVYYYGADNKRYVFPNQKTFNTWYDNFDDVIKISDSQLASIPLGKNITYKPGVRMIKIQTSSKVYAVERGGKLRWVQTEDVARNLYGANWNQMIDDVPDVFFTNYKEEGIVLGLSDYNPTQQRAGTQTIGQDRGISSGPLTVERESETAGPSGVQATELVQPSDLVYRGAFRLPESAGPEGTGWEWGGLAATHYHSGDSAGGGDGYPGSLFSAGHNWYAAIGEISIPVPVNSKNLSNLNTARSIGGFADVRDEMFGYLEIPRSGLSYLPAQGNQREGKIYFSMGQHMEEGDTSFSHGWIDTNLSLSSTAGPWRIGEYWRYVTTDYMFNVPENFANQYLGGMQLVTGRFRDGGQGTQGPSVIAIAPWQDGNPPVENSRLNATPLLLYSSVYEDEGLSNALNDYHDSDSWSGGAWLTKNDKSAVIIAGMKGRGQCWYGYPDGTSWYKRGDADWVDGLEGEGERGWWSDRWEATILFYDPADLAEVARGNMQPWEPQPYATLSIHDKLFNPATHNIRELGSVAYDRESGLLYVFEYLGDAENERPIVHVWQIN